MRVLVIDDDDITRLALCDILEDAGDQVVDFASPIGATRALVEHEIDALVVDLFMPAMSGDKLARLVRGNRRTKHVAIVLVSSMEPVELDRIRKEADADASVNKADVRHRLATTVRSAVAQRRNRKSDRTVTQTRRNLRAEVEAGNSRGNAETERSHHSGSASSRDRPMRFGQ